MRTLDLQRMGGTVASAAPVSTYYVGMNVTLSLGDKLLERARRLAARRGISLNQMIRDYLAEVTGEPSPEELGG